MNTRELLEGEKQLLTMLGNNPGITMKELVTHTRYKWPNTIVKKVKQLREQHLVFGPYHVLDHNRLCKNTFHLTACVLESRQSFETVISYLKLIEPLRWIYPALSPYRSVLIAGFLSSDDAEMKALLNLLKDNEVISTFSLHVCDYKNIHGNPNFSGDLNPSLDDVLDPCNLPDMSLGTHTTEWNECDISILPYLLGIESSVKLMDIIKKERKLNRIWKYSQVRYSYEKMMKNQLIEKTYTIHPLPWEQCAHFRLVIGTEDTLLTRRIMHNFARGARVNRMYTLVEELGVITCSCHPVFLTDLLYKLDKIEEIKRKELYQRRSFTGDYSFNPPILPYFDVGTQKLEYPYHWYREKTKEKLESGTVH